MPMIIRDATQADLSAITEIYAESVNNGVATYELEPPSIMEMTARFGVVTGNRYPYIVAEHDGTILGYAYAGPFRTRPAYNWICEDSIYLAPEARGKGVGSALLSELLARCEALGFRQMIAVIGGAHPASVAVHAKAGFEHQGTLKATGYKHGRWLDTTFMEKALGEGSTTDPDTRTYPGTLYRA
ncbi:N-acetyltransferase family protein [Pseudohoeflea suaedae]|uniref:N-acetyltransferase family protein n=1 Tax=Pseudohoeflea suaedae TaxID=877384 RepID=A0A4R5PLF9_9HYPH|nr:GNAT family N-acetyltransferase [Pseudohoeflea suaedae]TDH37709.1 N-acetyltransferase family protein [Pseudohoeflea suaedae]